MIMTTTVVDVAVRHHRFSQSGSIAYNLYLGTWCILCVVWERGGERERTRKRRIYIISYSRGIKVFLIMFFIVL